MNKFITCLLLCSIVQISNAQFLWYENETDTYQIEFESTTEGTFYTDVANPDDTGINTNAIVSEFNREEGLKGSLHFDLYNPVTDFSAYTVTIKAYLDLPTASLSSSNSKLRVFFESSSVGNRVFQQLNFTVGQAWQSFTFDFDGSEIPQEVLDANGYDLIEIGFANGSTVEPAMTYYLDAISGTTEQVVNAAEQTAGWLSGSWGVTFPVFGGERLDTEVAGGYDLPSGAQEVIDELPATGHIITNLSYFAHSHYFTLRENNNVDVAAEIHESLVPSTENEAIILEVLQKFQDSGKKIILYISTNYLDRADDDTQAAWADYYTDKFAGDEYLAYRDLVEGYVERVKDYADGYWLDTTTELRDDENLVDFIEMIRATDPSAAISVTGVTTEEIVTNFTDKNGEDILVDSDGLDDVDDRDYKISRFHAVNAYHDFTRGHVSSLASGAPPNSWAYEEFTIPAMVENPWSMFEGNTVLKHAWFPIRDKWHSPNASLMFGIEDAYRFTKQIVNAGGGVTFATTISRWESNSNNKGYMMSDEMEIMKEVNDRLLSVPMADCEPYVRPEGAYLVGEGPVVSVSSLNKTDFKLYPNPVAYSLTITRTYPDIDHILIVSAMGTKVMSKKWESGSLLTQLDLSGLNSGIYFINVSNDNSQSITRKLIIAK